MSAPNSRASRTAVVVEPAVVETAAVEPAAERQLRKYFSTAARLICANIPAAASEGRRAARNCHQGVSADRSVSLWAVLRIRIHFIRIRIQHIRLNTNLDPDPIRIQGFNDQKLKRNYS